MAQRGTVIGLIVWLALGCADSEPKPEDPDTGGNAGSAAVGGGGRSGNGGEGASGAGAGGAGAGAGAGGSGAGVGAGTGGDAGELACEHLLPSVYACVQGDGITAVGTDETHVELTGTVERAETDPFECTAEVASRAFGFVGMKGQSYVVRDGEAAIELTLGTGSERPLLAVGQRVRVTVDEERSGSIFLLDDVVLSVRDDADGRLLYWFARTDRGPERLELPSGFTAANAGPECSVEADCGVQYRRGLALREGDDEVAISIGELASIGDVSALLLDNSEQVLRTDGSCFDSAPYHKVSVALFDRELIAKCDWLDEGKCSVMDDCRVVQAYLVGYSDAAPRFIACVEDNSCSDGDVVTCAINDVTEQRANFSTNCVPPGWTEARGACDEDADAGTP